MREKTCEKRNEHDGHFYEVEVVTPCSGKTECGAWSHSAHTYLKKEQVKCNGICRCAYVSYPHSPTRHPEGKRVPFDV
jgi:hypothetical protein